MTAPARLETPRGATGARPAKEKAGERLIATARSRLPLSLLTAAVILFCLLPFVWLLITSVKASSEIYNSPTSYLPRPIDVSNWQEGVDVAAVHPRPAQQHDRRVQRDGDLAADRLPLCLRARPAAFPRQESDPDRRPRRRHVPRHRDHQSALSPVQRLGGSSTTSWR